jgi:hypothetical protein
MSSTVGAFRRIVEWDTGGEAIAVPGVVSTVPTRDVDADVSSVPTSGRIAGVPTLRLTQDDAADELLSRNPLAPLLGMQLDQHMSRGTEGAAALPGR